MKRLTMLLFAAALSDTPLAAAERQETSAGFGCDVETGEADAMSSTNMRAKDKRPETVILGLRISQNILILRGFGWFFLGSQMSLCSSVLSFL